ncbi:hypothetical protein GCM10009742_62790 [Kribbella karoonensis]|uniref:Secreted protein n=1 Tax=Kribbella karoonensis TaxID=324851 RepID=A0ABN2EFZ6_9ACTN
MPPTGSALAGGVESSGLSVAFAPLVAVGLSVTRVSSDVSASSVAAGRPSASESVGTSAFAGSVASDASVVSVGAVGLAAGVVVRGVGSVECVAARRGVAGP